VTTLADERARNKGLKRKMIDPVTCGGQCKKVNGRFVSSTANREQGIDAEND